jgi:hypothetical protein
MAFDCSMAGEYTAFSCILFVRACGRINSDATPRDSSIGLARRIGMSSLPPGLLMFSGCVPIVICLWWRPIDGCLCYHHASTTEFSAPSDTL